MSCLMTFTTCFKSSKYDFLSLSWISWGLGFLCNTWTLYNRHTQITQQNLSMLCFHNWFSDKILRYKPLIHTNMTNFKLLNSLELRPLVPFHCQQHTELKRIWQIWALTILPISTCGDKKITSQAFGEFFWFSKPP